MAPDDQRCQAETSMGWRCKHRAYTQAPYGRHKLCWNHLHSEKAKREALKPVSDEAA